MGERNLTSIALARALGVTHVAIGNYLKGRIPTVEILMKIAGYFQVSPDQLLGPGVSSLPKVHLSKGKPSSVTKSRGHQSVSQPVFLQSPIESETEKTKAKAIKKVFDEELERLKVKITPDDLLKGCVVAKLEYRTQSPPEGLPAEVTLTLPDFRESRKLLMAFRQDNDPIPIFLACLPADLRNDSFLNKLSPFCIEALIEAAKTLTLGA